MRASHLIWALCSRGDMREFQISRIHTSIGIFRLAGSLELSHGAVNVNYDSAAFMGTDGWCELNLESVKVLELLARIQNEVVEHLS